MQAKYSLINLERAESKERLNLHVNSLNNYVRETKRKGLETAEM
jgi:hypothetical protein